MKNQNNTIALDGRNLGQKGGIGTYSKNIISHLTDFNAKEYTVFNYENSNSKLEDVILYSRHWLLYCNINLPIHLYLKNFTGAVFFELPGPFFCPVPFISVLHDIIPFKYPEINKGSLKGNFIYLWQKLIKNGLDNSKHIVTVSEFSKNEISSFFNIDSNKISIVYNAVDNSIFNKDISDHKKIEFKQKYNLNRDYILNVSRFDKNKNQLNLLKAFKNIDYKNFELVLIGSKSNSTYYYDCEEFIRVNGLNNNVKLLSNIDISDLALFYTCAKSFIFPSLYEGFGIPPLEAISCGCPIYVSNKTSLSEIYSIKNIQFNPTNINEISALINNCFKHEFLYPHEEVLDSLGKYSWSNSANLFQSLINEYLINGTL